MTQFTIYSLMYISSPTCFSYLTLSMLHGRAIFMTPNSKVLLNMYISGFAYKFTSFYKETNNLFSPEKRIYGVE
jgi:hypothetical protein